MSVARLVNLVLSGILTGNELGTLAVVHPAFETLDDRAWITAEQAVTRRYGRVMPVVMPLTIASGIVALSTTRQRRSPSFGLTLAGVASQSAMLGITLMGNVPLNQQTLAASPDEPAEPFKAIRRRWDRLHRLRVALDLAGMVLLTAGALTQQGERRRS